MNGYQQLQWIKHRWRAKSRHGIHSPFVYHFSETVLYKQSSHGLKNRIAAYFKEEDLQFNDWNLSNISPATVIVFENIHASPPQHQAWLQLLNDPRITMSIDTFYFGILLFRKEFKIHQHFLLRS